MNPKTLGTDANHPEGITGGLDIETANENVVGMVKA